MEKRAELFLHMSALLTGFGRVALLGDAKLGPVARNLILLWYCGTWTALPDAWRAAPDTTVAEAVMKQNLFGAKLRDHLASTLLRHVRFSINVEQLPSSANGVSIDPRHLDPLGYPRPVISYRIDDYTLAGMAAATDFYREVFRHAGISDCSNPDEGTWFPSVAYGDSQFHYHGMGHFAGTHVMGDHSDLSVVDSDQRSWEHCNLYLVGAGSFPTMGTSNPR